MSAPVSAVPVVLIDPTQPLPLELRPSVDHLVTEDDTPVDNIYSERQQRLLTRPLYSSWAGPGDGRSFLALANVGLFYAVNQPAVVPDMMLSINVHAPENLHLKVNRSYFIWEFGKKPDVSVEIVSNLEGGELSDKKDLYAEIAIPYYIVWDADCILSEQRLSAFILQGKRYIPLEKLWFPEVGLGLTVWSGTFEQSHADWLRWCDQAGVVIPTGEERANIEHQRAESEHQRAEGERQRAEAERRRADQAEAHAARLAEQLRQLGIEPQ